ncbi:MAG: Adenosylhomocysteinase (EC [uncultured Paraburkholderia sp.]|uniref:flagellar protein FliT n=2 Tax=uncultured Paraburkholderia sp. TaxID=1822466 RepID=UPI0025998117|nr:flagellar protein FliT [uncultured Paraburkholderia sp.]CAH2900028.1 MAG: Adenosylhomocysteinase (EC [uncultured Paraburkholderia sp.]
MEQSALIEKVLALTGEIEHAAALADWPEAARLAELRSPLIMSLDAQQVQGSLDVIRSIVARNDAIFADAQTTQVELQAEYTAAMRRASAANQYQKAAQL